MKRWKETHGLCILPTLLLTKITMLILKCFTWNFRRAQSLELVGGGQCILFYSVCRQFSEGLSQK